MQTGGNSAFLTFLNYYNIGSAPIEYKYCTSAAAYYKDMLIYLSKGHEYNRELLTVSKGQEEIFQINSTSFEVVEMDIIRKDEADIKQNCVENETENKAENQGEIIGEEHKNIENKKNNLEPEEKPQLPEPNFLKKLENSMLKLFSKASSTALGNFVEDIGQKLIQVSDQITMEVKEFHK
ncbi:hypothetical protein SteCoe_14568 [Stentor coeruleus]|uniref:Uncharacterized protein n=1 Tax=Stentor coeruleus TaxID=5963 RepID=A0A1R2C5Q3_9CILI|nr:hypothetical protein SteCoe_14568 [Stentor coeruleus]